MSSVCCHITSPQTCHGKWMVYIKLQKCLWLTDNLRDWRSSVTSVLVTTHADGVTALLLYFLHWLAQVSTCHIDWFYNMTPCTAHGEGPSKETLWMGNWSRLVGRSLTFYVEFTSISVVINLALNFFFFYISKIHAGAFRIDVFVCFPTRGSLWKWKFVSGNK